MQRDEVIPILDFGAQYAQLIARRVREKGVYSELVRNTISADELKKMNPKGIILSGGPASVYEPNAPRCDPEVFELGVPVLGICYGMQLGAQILGGQVKPAKARAYRAARLHVVADDHDLPPKFAARATTPTCPYAAARHRTRPFYGVQFHPEVTHTPRGQQIFQNFLYDICKCAGNWTMGNFIEHAVQTVRKQVGDAKVICGLSGGVDSAVVAGILHRAIGDRLACIF